MPTDPGPAAQPVAPETWPEIRFETGDRILVLAPHPDDESIACGGVIQRALAAGLPVRVVYLTFGDNNEWSFMVYRKRLEILPWQVRAMGEVRHDEAIAAAGILGLAEGALTFLGYPDFGTLRIWCAHWGDAKPFRSMLTRVDSVPYENAYRKGADYKGEEIVRDLTDVLLGFRPTHVFVSHPADHNPDHVALYLFSHLALWGLGEALRPQLLPFLVHYPHWPRPRGLIRDATITPPEQLGRRCAWRDLRLAEQEESRKLAAIHAHRSQYDYSHEKLDSFVRVDELFGDFKPVRLRSADYSGVALGPDPGAPPVEPPEELEDEERARFVGVESHKVRLVDDHMELAIGLSRPLAREVAANLYCFGYRADRPFASMPKLHVEIGEGRHRVSDQTRVLARDAVDVRREARNIVIRVPVDLLEQPQRVLLSAGTRLGDIPLSSQPWRVLELTTAG